VCVCVSVCARVSQMKSDQESLTERYRRPVCVRGGSSGAVLATVGVGRPWRHLAPNILQSLAPHTGVAPDQVEPTQQPEGGGERGTVLGPPQGIRTLTENSYFLSSTSNILST